MTLTNGWTEIFLDNSNGNIIDSNKVSNSAWGIALDNSNYNTISYNTSTGNTFSGIDLESNDLYNSLLYNTVTKNKYGISSGTWTSSSSNTITGNIATNNQYGYI